MDDRDRQQREPERGRSRRPADEPPRRGRPADGDRRADERTWPPRGGRPDTPPARSVPPADPRQARRAPTTIPPATPARQRQAAGRRVAEPPPPVRGSLPTMTPPPRRQTKLFKLGLTALAAIVLLAVCGSGVWGIWQDERKGYSANAAPTSDPTEKPRDISTRDVDPHPLTVSEVFPTKQIQIVEAGGPPYILMGTQALSDCRTAADGELKAMLADLGCTQAIRGTLRSPTKDYLVTTGIFNLETEAGAKEAYDTVKKVVDAHKGRFRGYLPSTAARPLALASTHLGWDYRGHYLVYCVIARADGKEFAEGDPFAKQILYDMIELHLLGKIVHARATIKIGPTAEASEPAASPPAA